MITILCAAAILISLFFYYQVPGGSIGQKLIHPVGFLNIFFLLIHFSVPILQEVYGMQRFDYFTTGDNQYVLYAVLLSLAYLVLVNIFYIALGNKRIPFEKMSRALNSPNQGKKSVLGKRSAIALSLLGVFFVVNIALQNSADIASFMTNRINILSGQGYQYKLLSFIIPAAILIACDRFSRRRGIFSAGFFVIFLLVAVASLSIGSRSQALIAIPFVVATWIYLKSYRLEHRDLRRILMVLIAVFAVAAVLGLARDLVKGGYLDNDDYAMQSDSETPILVKEAVQSFGHTELLAFSIKNSSFMDYKYGATYLSAFIAFVPRSIWESKPVGAGPVLANLVAPGSYVLGAGESNSSLTTGAVIEAFLNFGFLGVFVFAALHAFLLSELVGFAKRIRTHLQFAIYLQCFYFFSALLVNAEFLGGFTGFAFITLPLILLDKYRFSSS